MSKLLCLLALLHMTCFGNTKSYDSKQNVIQMSQNQEDRKVEWSSDLRNEHPKLPTMNLMKRKLQVADDNLHLSSKQSPSKNLRDAPLVDLEPGQPAEQFSIPTLQGDLVYPGPVINQTVPILFHAYNRHSGFAQCLWNCSGSVEYLVQNSPNNTHYVLLSTSDDAYTDALWMQKRFKSAITALMEKKSISSLQATSLLSRLHFVTLAVSELGNWIPLALHQWMCLDHNCGLDQIRINSSKIQETYHRPLVVPRLDARYDWLPSPSKFGNQTLAAIFVGDGCHSNNTVKGKVAVITDGNCRYFEKVSAMQQSGAVAIIMISPSSVQDIACVDQECQMPLSIPASSIVYTDSLESFDDLTIQYQSTPTDNFFIAINSEGKLAQVGWLLYPSMSFLVYQAQWFEYEQQLQQSLNEPASVINIFANASMQGSPGAQVTLSLPSQQVLSQYAKVELDLSLSCPGSGDETCPHWDHTVQLEVTRRKEATSAEMGRWISPFRRRTGRWLSDVTPLVPLLDSSLTTFTLKTEPWAMQWNPSLNLRLSGQRKAGDLYPYKTDVLYCGDSFTFDKHYNSLFKPLTQFQPPQEAKKVEIYSVITGHGSDENGCGEFCVTSHHYTVNSKEYSITFDTAGSALGCTLEVPRGAVPNEHGTWLYGRDGWCDGQNVRPWVLDITNDLYTTELQTGNNLQTGVKNNTITYHGYFNGTDPNPKNNPGIMILHSYLVYYKELEL